MVRRTVDEPLATTQVGAYPKIDWFRPYQFDGEDMLEAFKDKQVEHAYRDAVNGVIKDQEQVGLDIVSDGKVAYDDYAGGTGWFHYTLDRLEGLSGRTEETTSIFKDHPLEIIQEMAGAYGTPIATGKIRNGGLRLARQYKIANELTDKTIKINIGDPSTIGTMIMPGEESPYDEQEDLIMDLCEIYNEELTALADAGCPIIQTDTSPINVLPAFRDVPQDEFDFWIDAYNTTIDGVDAETWIHCCWGRLHGQPLLGAGEEQAWDTAYPQLLETDADTVNMHFSHAADNEAIFEVLGEYDTDKNIALGAISINSLLVESPDDVKDFINTATQYVPRDQLYLTTDCGLVTVMDREIAKKKLNSLVNGAERAREREVTMPGS